MRIVTLLPLKWPLAGHLQGSDRPLSSLLPVYLHGVLTLTRRESPSDQSLIQFLAWVDCFVDKVTLAKTDLGGVLLGENRGRRVKLAMRLVHGSA